MRSKISTSYSIQKLPLLLPNNWTTQQISDALLKDATNVLNLIKIGYLSDVGANVVKTTEYVSNLIKIEYLSDHNVIFTIYDRKLLSQTSLKLDTSQTTI